MNRQIFFKRNKEMKQFETRNKLSLPTLEIKSERFVHNKYKKTGHMCVQDTTKCS